MQMSVCPVCSSSKSKEVYPDELNGLAPSVDYAFSPITRLTFRIVECLACEHQFVNPVPDLNGLYEENEDPIYLASNHQRILSARSWMKIVAKHCANARRLIDIGCATGVFLDEAAKSMDVSGIELSRWSGDIASQNHEVFRHPVSQLTVESRYDVATLWGVIEHLDNPASEVRAIRQILNDRGLLFVYTGDRSAWLPKILGKKWWWYQGMHIQYFTKSSLTRLLVENGFEIIGSDQLPIYFSLHSIGQSMNRYKLAKPLVWLFQNSPVKNIVVRLKLSGEMLLIARCADNSS